MISEKVTAVTKALGPAWLVMMADVDVASIITGLQAGSTWGYRMVFVMIALTVPLFLIQDATGRLGAAAGMGLGHAILKYYGRRTAVLAALPMAVSDVLEYVAEFAGVAVGLILLRLPVLPGLIAVFILHTAVVVGRQYREAQAILLPVSFVLVAMILATAAVFPANAHELMSDGITPLQPYLNRKFDYLMAASIGAVIMPWMLYFQSGAASRNSLTPGDIGRQKWMTLTGAVVSEVLMSVIVIDGTHIAAGGSIISIHGIALEVAGLGSYATLALGIGFVAAGFLALVVISLGSAWGALEGLGLHSRKSFMSVYFAESIPALVVVVLVSGYVELMLNLMVIYTVIVIPSLFFLGRLVSNKRVMNDSTFNGIESAAFYIASASVVAGGLLGVISLIGW